MAIDISTREYGYHRIPVAPKRFLLNARVPAGNSAASGAAEVAGAASAGAAEGRHLGVSLGSL